MITEIVSQAAAILYARATKLKHHANITTNATLGWGAFGKTKNGRSIQHVKH